MASLTKPPALRPGDTIAVVAPASGPPVEKIEAGIACLKAAGYGVRTYREFKTPDGYLSATDDERAEEFNRAVHDEEVRAILAARGGYGLTRILDRLDYDALRRNPKIVAGYSDLSALHTAIGRQARLVSFHSPHAVEGLGPGGDCEMTSEAFFRTLGDPQPPPPIARNTAHPDAIVPTDWGGGAAEGPLVGGNLAVLCGLLGTPYLPDTRGALLLIEDTGEAIYRVDRMLSQLRLTGVLGEIAGVVLGYFSEVPPDGGDLLEVLREYLAPLGVPVLGGIPVGHSLPNYTLALGARYRIDTAAGELACAESLVV